jgi:hypothetical protein
MLPHPQEFDPDSIIAAVLRGETDWFRLLVREYGLLVRGFLATRLYHHEDVEELGMGANAIYQARFRAHASLQKCMAQATPNMPGPGA